MLAAMHRLEPATIGLGRQPVVSIKAEIDRWVRAYETSPPHLQFNYTEVADALHASIPEQYARSSTTATTASAIPSASTAASTPSSTGRSGPSAIPRVDLTWLTFFCDDSGHPSKASDAPSGMPSSAELLRVLRGRGRRGATPTWTGSTP